MEKVSDYMAEVIEEDGKINYLGYDFSYSFHALCLMDYGKKKYPKISFDKIDYMEDPFLPIYYLTRLNDIVFTNVSTDDEKRGMLFLPQKVTSSQVKSLHEFISQIKDFEVSIGYDLVKDDMVVCKETSLEDKDFLNEFLRERCEDFSHGKSR